MKSLLTMVFVLLLCVIGFGFYQGWFAVSSPSPKAGSHEVNLNLSVDRDKIKADTDTVMNKAEEIAGQAKEGASELVGQDK